MHSSNKTWIQNAIKHKGALTRKALRANMTPMEFAFRHRKDKNVTGLQSRLALRLRSFHKPSGKGLANKGGKNIGYKSFSQASSGNLPSQFLSYRYR